MDVHQSALLGQHALAYAVLSFLASALHRRLLWFSVPYQALQVLPLFVAAHLIALLVRMLGGAAFPGVGVFIAPLLEALLWPVVSVLLLAPQRRAPDPDENRPL
jgi:rod shape-determining protein MreD